MSTKQALGFEAALRRLEEIVRRLEEGDVELEESIKIYEEGMELKALCEEKLTQARMRVEKITLSADGKQIKTKPFSGEK